MYSRSRITRASYRFFKSLSPLWFDVQVLLFYFLFYFMLLEEMHAATLRGTTSLSILLSRVFCLFVCNARHAFRGRGLDRGVRGVHGKALYGEGCATPVSWRSGPRARRYVISKYLRAEKWPENGRKMGKNSQN